jgi:hypothetical protein
MPKAQIALTDGTKITIEGTSDEVSAFISKFSASAPLSSKEQKRSGKKSEQRTLKSKPGPVDLISELIDGGFFKKPKELGSIRLALEEQGHYYPVTTLSPILLRIVRKKLLRRIKDKKRWLYVG